MKDLYNVRSMLDYLVYFNWHCYVTSLNKPIVSNKLLSVKLGKLEKLVAHFTRISSRSNTFA